MVARSILDLLEASTARFENADAFVYGETRLSYAYFSNVVSRLATGLSRTGVKPGHRVALMMPNLPQFPIAYYALLSLGAVVVPVNILLREAELEYLLQDAQIQGVITWEGFGRYLLPAARNVESCQNFAILGQASPEFNEMVKPYVLCDLTKLIADSSPLAPRPAMSGEEPAAIFYTAGVNGTPRGAVHTHASLAAAVTACWEALAVDHQHRFAAALPLFHGLGQMLTMNLSLAAGAGCVLMPRLNVTEVVAMLAREHVTHFAAVPAMLRLLLDGLSPNGAPVIPEPALAPATHGHDLSSLRAFFVSGAPLEQTLRDQLRNVFDKPVYEGYGIAECSPLITCNRPDITIRPGSVGKQLPGLEVTIMDHAGAELPPGEIGEIVVRGNAIMSGYYHRPQETQVALREGWLYTGDAGWLDTGGYLYLVDRQCDVIRKGGFPVFSQEVERCLMFHPAVQSCAVIGVPDRVWGEEVKAFVVLRPQLAVSREELYGFCASRLAKYKCPRIFEFCSELPHGPTGRIQKRMLREKSGN
ncbi:MAG: AMP-binding protein [bacterium]